MFKPNKLPIHLAEFVKRERRGAVGGGGGECREKGKVQIKSAGARFSDMSTEQDVASPASAVLERRQSHTTQQKRKQEECAATRTAAARSPETGSDGEWSGDNDPLSDCKESAKSIRGGGGKGRIHVKRV